MSRAMDVASLSNEAARAVDSPVALLRDKAAPPTAPRPSIIDVAGKAPVLRTREDIERQVQEERGAWDEP